jgi:carbonic anhydrase/acetyltransferase-like protein (isoleucine patch superfamily)
MAIYKLGNLSPRIDSSAYVASEATITAAVHLAGDVSVWPGAVLRGDNEPIHVGSGSNIQEGAILHTDPGYPIRVGNNVTVGHQAMLHGCTVGDGSLIGIQAVVLNGAIIGRDCIVAAGAVVTEGKSFADGSLILGAPAKAVRQLEPEQIAALRESARVYVEKSHTYKANLEQISSGDAAMGSFRGRWTV